MTKRGERGMMDATLYDAVVRVLEGGEGTDPRLGWLSVASGYQRALRAGRPGDARELVRDFTAGLGGDGVAPEFWVEAAEALASVRGARDMDLCSLLAALFSSFRGEREHATRSARLAAARLCAAALDATP